MSPTIPVQSGEGYATAPDSIDAAWAAVEAALPKRWTITLDGDWEHDWSASVTYWSVDGPVHKVKSKWYAQPGFRTPALALRALAAKLAER